MKTIEDFIKEKRENYNFFFDNTTQEDIEDFAATLFNPENWYDIDKGEIPEPEQQVLALQINFLHKIEETYYFKDDKYRNLKWFKDCYRYWIPLPEKNK